MLTLRESLIHEVKKVGCVYPDHEDSYYISSNLLNAECIQCIDGFYYRESE